MRRLHVAIIALGAVLAVIALAGGLVYYFLDEDDEGHNDVDKTQHAHGAKKPSVKPTPPKPDSPKRDSPKPDPPKPDPPKSSLLDINPPSKEPPKPWTRRIGKKPLEPIKIEIKEADPPPAPDAAILAAAIKKNDREWVQQIYTFGLGMVHTNSRYVKQWGGALVGILWRYTMNCAAMALDFVIKEWNRPRPKQIGDAPPKVKPAKAEEKPASPKPSMFMWFTKGDAKSKDGDINDDLILQPDLGHETTCPLPVDTLKPPASKGKSGGFFGMFGGWSTPAKVEIKADELVDMQASLLNIESWAKVAPAVNDTRIIEQTLRNLAGDELLAAYEATELFKSTAVQFFAAQVIKSPNMAKATKVALLACLSTEALAALPGGVSAIDEDGTRIALETAVLEYATDIPPIPELQRRVTKEMPGRNRPDSSKTPPDIGADDGLSIDEKRAFLSEPVRWVGKALLPKDSSVWKNLTDLDRKDIIVAYEVANMFRTCTHPDGTKSADESVRNACVDAFVRNTCKLSLSDGVKLAMFTSLAIDDLKHIVAKAKTENSSRTNAAKLVFKSKCPEYR